MRRGSGLERRARGPLDDSRTGARSRPLLCLAAGRSLEAAQKSSWRHRANLDLTLAPHGLPTHAGELRGFKKRNEFGKVAFVFGFAHEPSDRMNLAGPAAAAM